jgi:RimJ/RimL family protein N-acetyltransferase
MADRFPSSFSVPMLETDRLVLRGHRREDLEACFALWSDPTVTQYTVGMPLSKEDVWSRLLRYVGHWHWLGFGYWAVEEKSTGNFVGDVGFADLKREISPRFDGIPELGWVLMPSIQGKGYATEAALAALAWCENSLPSPQTACIIHPDNAASLRVAMKIGFREALRTSYRGKPTTLFFRERSSAES